MGQDCECCSNLEPVVFTGSDPFLNMSVFKKVKLRNFLLDSQKTTALKRPRLITL